MQGKKNIIIAILLAIITEIVFYFVETNVNWNIKNITTVFIVIVCVFSILFSKKIFKNKYQQYLFLVIMIGLLIRLMYISYTSIMTRQHDIINFTNSGHLNYIISISETGHLPISNLGQFYHPPLFHIIESLSFKFTTSIGLTIEKSAEILQYVTCFISFLTMLVIWKIVERLKINNSLKILINTFLVFHPQFILLSGCVNNDVLLVFLELLVILYLLHWYDKPNLKNTIILAIATGLCVMTKISGAVMAVPILFVFVKKLFFDKQGIKSQKKLLWHILLFGLISLPIGLWYPVRNYILFQQSLSYVPIPIEILSVKRYNVFERFFTFPLYEIGEIFANPYRDYSLPIYSLKTSLFGDDLNDYINIIEVWLLLEALILSVIFVIMLIKYIRKKEKNTSSMLFLVVFFTMILSFLYFNIKMPYGCTMDFRYIVPTALLLSIFLVDYLDRTEHLLFRRFTICTCYFFSLLSITMFYTL